jgi:hypothetical protein
VAGRKDGVDLRVEARIAGSSRCRWLHCWALLWQVGGLRKIATRDWQISLARMLTHVL